MRKLPTKAAEHPLLVAEFRLSCTCSSREVIRGGMYQTAIIIDRRGSCNIYIPCSYMYIQHIPRTY